MLPLCIVLSPPSWPAGLLSRHFPLSHFWLWLLTFWLHSPVLLEVTHSQTFAAQLSSAPQASLSAYLVCGLHFSPINSPFPEWETVATWLSLLYFRCIVLFSGTTEQLNASSPTVTSPLEFSLGFRLSCPLALHSYKVRDSFKPSPFLGDWLARAAHRMHECIFPIITSSLRRKELQGEANEEILSVGDGAGDTEPPCPPQAGCLPSTAVHPALSEACC